MTKRAVPSLLIAALAVALNGATGMAASEQQDPVYVDSTDILYLESFPVQVVLQVDGALPTPCHEAAWDITETETSVDVTLWSTSDSDSICATVLEPVQLAIPLGSYESADLDVSLNGEDVGRIEIGDGAASDAPGLAGAGWSFGMCLGYCSADLSVDGATLVQSGHDREAAEPLYVNGGELTADGQMRIDAAVAALDGVALEATYGCPDCADGGAAYLTLRGTDRESRHDMEFGAPPEALAELHDLAMAVMTALETCEANELVDTDEECTAYER